MARGSRRQTKQSKNAGCLNTIFRLIGAPIKALSSIKLTLPIGRGYQASGLLIGVFLCALCICGSIGYVWTDTQLRTIGLLPTYTPHPTATNTPVPTVTSTPTDTPAPPPSPTETPPPLSTEAPPTETPIPEKPIVTATESNVNLRNGPSTDYEIVGTLSPGESLEIVGRNADSSWWQVSTPGGLAWVAASAVTASNIDDSIPVVEAPLSPVQPTDTPYIEPTSPPAVECPYIGNSNTGKFHHFWCSSVDDMKEEHKVCLQSREEAINKGYEPCGNCNP
jgi:hypothetical protein